MIERDIEIETPDGVIDTFVCHPEEGGPHPAVIFYMDAIGVREELRDMARRIGTCGYYVMLPNLFYRTTRAADFHVDPDRIGEDGPDKSRMWSMIKSVSNAGAVADTRAMLPVIDADPAAAAGGLGAVGYCLSGQFVLAVAGQIPEAFSAIASYYGAGMHTDRDDSPHLTANRIQAELYLAFAEVDHYVPDAQVQRLDAHLRSVGADYRIETYPGVAHGFAFPGRAVYDKAAAERHWERMLALFRRRLG